MRERGVHSGMTQSDMKSRLGGHAPARIHRSQVDFRSVFGSHRMRIATTDDSIVKARKNLEKDFESLTR